MTLTPRQGEKSSQLSSARCKATVSIIVIKQPKIYIFRTDATNIYPIDFKLKDEGYIFFA
ncbi:hypothetical protein XBJ1_3086 [Xenorhabdus bovienii SS-2004]|uniref:Uncharacterized protein n=1 Tax=Xenorhabdus bovienii (strain SS-2004) TaxID=406818 RepID=D3V3I0_XENBS|nr:hypothetical protein XBJ1_3086 [Xenorhabdus bovienii SS-2004]